MRQFYLAHKIVPLTAQLTWTQHVELLPLKNKALRRKIEHKIVRQKLSQKQIMQVVHEANQALLDKGLATHWKP